MLKNIPIFLVPAKDEIPKDCSILDISEIQNQNQPEIGGLATILELKFNAKVMITTNIDVYDRLIKSKKKGYIWPWMTLFLDAPELIVIMLLIKLADGFLLRERRCQ